MSRRSYFPHAFSTSFCIVVFASHSAHIHTLLGIIHIVIITLSFIPLSSIYITESVCCISIQIDIDPLSFKYEGAPRRGPFVTFRKWLSIYDNLRVDFSLCLLSSDFTSHPSLRAVALMSSQMGHTYPPDGNNPSGSLNSSGSTNQDQDQDSDFSTLTKLTRTLMSLAGYQMPSGLPVSYSLHPFATAG
jgi:hypothetical protein